MNEQNYRNKIYIFSTILSILVIWVHSVNVELFFHSEHPIYLEFIQNILISLGQISVPGFFILSSYLFFHNLDNGNFPRKLHRRFSSLVLPFLIWNTIYYIAYFLGSRIPFLRTILGKGVIGFEWKDLMEAIFFYKYNFVFWFVFQLILLILLTPLFSITLKNKISGIILVILSLGYLCIKTRIYLLNVDALVYFVLGAFLSKFYPVEVEKDFCSKHLFLGILLGIFAYTINQFYLVYGLPVLAVISRCLGVLTLWLCLFFPKNIELPSFFKNSFFVYAIHFLIARLINKSFAHMYPRQEYLAIGLFLFMPFLILILSDILVLFLKKYANRFYRILSGNR